MAYSWAKVYIEILDDVKMGQLPDNLWRRVIEMILLAKRIDKDGTLPGLAEMAWTLRTSIEQLEADLQRLQSIHVVEIKDGNWFLTNFSKRQAAEPDSERAKNYRSRKSNDSVTNRDIDKTRLDEDIPSEARSATRSKPTQHKAPEPKPEAVKPSEAVKAYRSVSRTFPDKSTWGNITDTVGDDAARLKFWREVVSGYIAVGWNKRNVTGMLDWFSRGEIPHIQRKGNGHSLEPVQIKPKKVYR